jgi:hypothetical protein
LEIFLLCDFSELNRKSAGMAWIYPTVKQASPGIVLGWAAAIGPRTTPGWRIEPQMR